MATGNLEEDFGRESKRFTDTISKFTEQTSGVTQSITKFVKASKLSGDTLEKFSGSLKTQLENLSSNIDGLSDEIFKSDKPFLVDTQKLNEKIGVAQATIDVLSAKLENSGNEFVELTESEKEVVKQQIAAARQLVEQTQAFGFGAKQVLAQLQTRTLSSVEDFTLSQISRVPIIGPFFSGFISDTIKILRTRRIERAKAAKETLLQEAKEKAQRESDIDFLVKTGAVKDRQEAERRLLQERENNIKQERINAELEQLKQFKERGLISDKQFKENTDQASAGKIQDVRIDESNADDFKETVNIGDESVSAMGDNIQQGVTEGITATLTKTFLPNFKSILTRTFALFMLPLKAINLSIAKLVAIFRKPDASRLKEMNKIKPGFDTSGEPKDKEEKGGGLGFIGLALAGISTALSAASLKAPAILLGGAAIGGGLAAVFGLGGIGMGIGSAATGWGLGVLAGGLKKLTPELDDFLPKMNEMSKIDGEALKKSAEGIGAFAGALTKFALAGLTESVNSVVSGITGLFTDTPMEKLEKFGTLGDDVQKTADALEDATPKLEKFYNMLAGKDFSKLAGFTSFTEEFLEGSQNIVKAFKGGRNVVSGLVFKGLEDIKVESIDQVKGLIDSVSNLARVNMINNLSMENRMAALPTTGANPPFISSNVINQNNSQGVVISKSVNNDSLDHKIISRYN